MLASSYPLLDLFLTILYVFLFVIWLFLLIEILIDLFRSHDVSGWMKALWLIFILIFPLVGVIVYLIVRGGTMRRHQQESAKAAQQEFVSYVQQTAGTSTSSPRWRPSRRAAPSPMPSSRRRRPSFSASEATRHR